MLGRAGVGELKGWAAEAVVSAIVAAAAVAVAKIGDFIIIQW